VIRWENSRRYIAPGGVLIGEAGGRVEQRPRPDGSIDFLCDNGVIHEELKQEAGW